MNLSSTLTPWIRTVLPLGWAALFPLVLFVPLPSDLGPYEPLRQSSEPIRLFYVAGLGILLAQWLFWYRRLRDLTATADGFSVAGRGPQDRARWSDVEAVERPWWGKGRFARLRLRSGHPLGANVVFMLPVELFTSFGNHPVVRYVEAAIAAARAVTPGRASVSSS